MADGVRSLGIRSLAIMGVRGLGLVLTIGMQILLARVLTPEQFGIYSYAFALLSVALVPSKLGWDLAAVRFLPAMSVGRDTSRSFVAHALVRVGVAGLVLGAVWFVVNSLLRIDDLSTERVWMLATALTLPILALLRVAEGCLRGANRVLIAYVPYAVVWPGLFAASVVVFEPWHDGSLGRVLVLQAVTMGIVALGSLAVLARSVHGTETPTGDERQSWRGAARVLTLTTGIRYGLGQFEVLFLGLLATAALTASYAAAWRVGQAASGFLVAFNFAFGPMASKIYAQGDMEKLQNLLSRITLLLSAASAVVCLAIAVFAPQIIGLFGEAYLDAVLPLRILLIGHFVNAATGPVVLLLNISGNEQKTLVVLVPVLLLGTASFAWFASQGSMVGVAATGAAVATVTNLGMAVLVWRLLGLRTIPAAHSLHVLRRTRR